MAPVLGVIERDDDLVAFAGPDLVVTARASVRLHRFVRLHVTDVDRVGGRHRSPNGAHATSANATTTPTTTISTSPRCSTRPRSGFIPIALTVDAWHSGPRAASIGSGSGSRRSGTRACRFPLDAVGVSSSGGAGTFPIRCRGATHQRVVRLPFRGAGSTAQQVGAAGVGPDLERGSVVGTPLQIHRPENRPIARRT